MADFPLPYQHFLSKHVHVQKKTNQMNKLMTIVMWQTPKASRNKPYNDSIRLSPPRHGFDATPFHVGFMEEKVTPLLIFILLRFTPASIIPPVLHTNSIIYHWRCIILSIKVIIQKHEHCNNTFGVKVNKWSFSFRHRYRMKSGSECLPGGL